MFFEMGERQSSSIWLNLATVVCSGCALGLRAGALRMCILWMCAFGGRNSVSRCLCDMGVVCVRLLVFGSAVLWVVCGCWICSAAAVHLDQFFVGATAQFIMAACFQQIGDFSGISDS